eukprot:2869723-Rhodomonas_salina.2
MAVGPLSTGYPGTGPRARPRGSRDVTGLARPLVRVGARAPCSPATTVTSTVTVPVTRALSVPHWQIMIIIIIIRVRLGVRQRLSSQL